MFNGVLNTLLQLIKLTLLLLILNKDLSPYFQYTLKPLITGHFKNRTPLINGQIRFPRITKHKSDSMLTIHDSWQTSFTVLTSLHNC